MAEIFSYGFEPHLFQITNNLKLFLLILSNLIFIFINKIFLKPKFLFLIKLFTLIYKMLAFNCMSRRHQIINLIIQKAHFI
jgi:hypothetical protein